MREHPGYNGIDEQSFRRLFETAQPGLFFLAYRLVGTQHEAEDAVTDSFIKLWDQRANFQTQQAATGWLRVTTRNACLDLLKHKKVRAEKIAELASEMHESETEPGHDDLLGEVLEEILRAVETLPEKSRAVFQLRYIEGLKSEEIASRLGIRYQSVRNHLSTALKTLRLRLGDKAPMLTFALILFGQKD